MIPSNRSQLHPKKNAGREPGRHDGAMLLSALKRWFKDMDFTRSITIEFTTHGLRTKIILEPVV